MKLKSSVLLALLVSAPALFAANEPSIGVATTLDASNNVADGSHLATASVPTEVRLANGADVRLATRSAGSFFSDHIALDEGALRVAGFSGLTVDAAQLEITGEDAGSQAIVRMNKETVEVASVGGAINVMDGGVLTRVAAGTKMSFQQSGASPTGQASPSATGANPAPAPAQKKMPGDKRTFLWVIGITAAAALAVGLTAAAQGKSPFR